MDAVEFVKAAVRYCDWCGKHAKKSCVYCQFHGVDSAFRCLTREAILEVEQWAKEHPVKTRQSEFLKMFPNAEVNNRGVLTVCPHKLDVTFDASECTNVTCMECRQRYWTQEVE